MVAGILLLRIDFRCCDFSRPARELRRFIWAIEDFYHCNGTACCSILATYKRFADFAAPAALMGVLHGQAWALPFSPYRLRETTAYLIFP